MGPGGRGDRRGRGRGDKRARLGWGDRVLGDRGRGQGAGDGGPEGWRSSPRRTWRGTLET